MMPPKVAPIQAIIIPIGKTDEEKQAAIKKAEAITAAAAKNGWRIKIDDRAQYTPGWKFNDWELKGVPLRLELGPKDLKKNQVVMVRRDTGVKEEIAIDKLIDNFEKIIADIQDAIFQRAKDFVKENTHEAKTFEELSEILNTKRGFVWASWCGESECEKEIKEKIKATIRCVPLDSKKGGSCVHCNKPAKEKVLFAQSY